MDRLQFNFDQNTDATEAIKIFLHGIQISLMAAPTKLTKAQLQTEGRVPFDVLGPTESPFPS